MGADDDLRRDALRNIADFNAATLGRRGRGTVVSGGLSMSAGHTPHAGPWFNSAVRIDGDVSAHDAVTHARAHFAALGHGFGLWADEVIDADIAALLDASGTPTFDDEPTPGMAIDARVGVPDVAATITLVTDDAGDADFCDALGVAYGFGAGIRGVLGPFPFDDTIRVFSARSDAQVEATVVGMRGEVGGIYMVGTRPDARRRGLGEAVTAVATNDLFDDGSRVVVLQASAMGEPIYARMGFRRFTTYRRFVFPPPDDASA
jgi:ribosomal protein S18 acetylase RimI-like enzyme